MRVGLLFGASLMVVLLAYAVSAVHFISPEGFVIDSFPDNYMVFVDGNEYLLEELSANEVMHPAQILIDNPQTRGIDYVGISANETTIVTYEAATVQGFIVDRVSNVIPNASLSLKCTHKLFVNQTYVTDKLGFFTLSTPKGACTVIAEKNNQIGFAHLYFHQGDLQYIQILLNFSQLDSIRNSQNNLAANTEDFGLTTILVFSLIIVALVSVGSYVYIRQVARKIIVNDKENKHSQTDDTFSDSAFTLIEKTLNAREREIVAILKNKQPINQTDLKHQTGLPKSTLSRILQKMEQKQLIVIDEVGKIKKITLSHMFHKK